MTTLQFLIGILPWAAMGLTLGSLVRFIDLPSEKGFPLHQRIWRWTWYNWKHFTIIWMVVLFLKVVTS